MTVTKSKMNYMINHVNYLIKTQNSNNNFKDDDIETKILLNLIMADINPNLLSKKLIELKEKKNFNINGIINNGDTLLSFAVEKRSFYSIPILLNCGANPTIVISKYNCSIFQRILNMIHENNSLELIRLIAPFLNYYEINELKLNDSELESLQNIYKHIQCSEKNSKDYTWKNFYS